MRLFRAALLCFAVACGIIGCVSIPPSLEEANSRQAPAYRPHFELTGRISVIKGERGEFGKLWWTCSQEKQEIALLSPLGQTVAEISQRDRQNAVLRVGSEIRSASTFDSLVQDALGTAVPIHDLAYWIQGVTDTRSGLAIINESDSAGRPESLFHSGWEISIEGYRRLGAAIVATRLQATKGDTIVKIIIDEWAALP